MVLLVVILAAVALIAFLVIGVAMSRLGNERELAATAARDRAAAEEQAAAALRAADERAAEATRQAAAAEERAAGLEVQATAAEDARRAAEERATGAEELAAQAERRVDDLAAQVAAAVSGSGIDPDLLWTMEQARSERTWRHSVAPGPDSPSVFATTSSPLREALLVELDAAREDIGAIVELDADLPPTVTAAGAVLALRATQELLAGIVRQAEETTVRVVADGADLVVTLHPIDDHGQPVAVDTSTIPASAHLEPVEGGLRVRGAVDVAPADVDVPAADGAAAAARPRGRCGRRRGGVVANRLTRGLWFGAGWVAVGIGSIGIVVPGLPTTVFFIVAAACFSRSSPRFERWVLTRPGVGPMVRDYRAGLGMPRRAKVAAICSIVVVCAISAVVSRSRLWLSCVIAGAGLVGIAWIAWRVPTKAGGASAADH